MSLLSVDTLPWIAAACLGARLLFVAARLELARHELGQLRQDLAFAQASLDEVATRQALAALKSRGASLSPRELAPLHPEFTLP